MRVLPLWCNSWGCEDCAPRRAYKLGRAIFAGQPNSLLTLTCDPKIGASPVHRCRIMKRELPRLIEKAGQRWGGKKIAYHYTVEEHESGEPHIHVALRAPYIPHKWLSRQWKALTGAKIIDIRAVKKKKGLARYLSKYMVKGLHQFGTCKRYASTRDWRVDPVEEPEPEFFWADRWYVHPHSQGDFKRRFLARGWDVAMEGTMLVGMARGPPEGP